MRLNEFDSYRWRNDVESFSRWRGFYDDVSSATAKETAIKRLRELQANWPHHKLGDMPQDIAT